MQKSQNINLKDIDFKKENALENFLNEHPEYILDKNKHLNLWAHLTQLRLNNNPELIEKKFFFSKDYPELLSKRENLKEFMQKNLNDPVFKKITTTLTSMRNLWLICEKKGITFEEFKKKYNVESNYNDIFAILNFDPVNYFSNEPLKNFINPTNTIKNIDEENEAKISNNEINENEANKIKEAIKNENNVIHIDFNDLDDYLKERAETIMTLNAFNVYTLPQNNFVPQNTFYNNPNLTPHIFMTNLQPFNYIVNNSKIFDYMNLIQADLLNNYENIVKENMLIGEVARPEIWDAIKKYLEYDENDLSKFQEKLKKMGLNDEDINKITENDAQQLFVQTAKLFTNIRTANESIKGNPELYAIFMISKPEKYLLTNNSEIVQKQIANELIDIVQKNPKEIDKLVKLLSCYSINDLFVKSILENKVIKEKCSNLKEKIIEEKRKLILENFKEYIPDNILVLLSIKDFTEDKINAIMPFKNSIDLLNPETIKEVLRNPQYSSIIQDIMSKETFNDLNSKTKYFLLSSLINMSIFKFLFIRFDLFEQICNFYDTNKNVENLKNLIGGIKSCLLDLNSEEITNLHNEYKESFNFFLKKTNDLYPNELIALQKFEQVRICNYSNEIIKITSCDKSSEEKKLQLEKFIYEIFDKEVKNTGSPEKAIMLLRQISTDLKNSNNENNAGINLAINIFEKKCVIENTFNKIVKTANSSMSNKNKIKELTDNIKFCVNFLYSKDLKKLIKKISAENSKNPNKNYNSIIKIVKEEEKKLKKDENKSKKDENNNIIPQKEKTKVLNRSKSTKKVKIINEQSK